MATETARPVRMGSGPSLGRKFVPYLYLSPALISILILSVLPLGFTVYLAFTDATLTSFKQGVSLVGFANFKEILTGSFKSVFFPVLGWTFLYALLSAATQYFAGMFIALRLNNPFMRESRFYRALLVIPWAIPSTIAILAWQGMFHTSQGTINRMLIEWFGMADKIQWLQNPNLAKVAVLVVNLWLGFPYFMTICLGALQSIPSELYEVADIDGANGWQKFWKVTYPLLLRFSAPLLVGSFAMNFNNFGTAFLMTGGGPNRVGPFLAGYSDILVSVGYKLTVNRFLYGLSAALSILLFFIVAIVTLVNMRVTGAFKEED